MTKSMTDAAYDIMSNKKRAVQFAKLWAEVSKVTGAGNDKVAQFYSDLTLDGRFAALKDNKWDLKTRRKFSESHIDMKKIDYEDVDESDYDPDGLQDLNPSEEDTY
ncbi:MAG: DNA-directed RNA polymerase subunit delta [Erysipelotrichaceae bacterium]|nr:DNA-directed RNA polymerase subunit delta [Erysipelotrichaceae bacterium]